MSPRGRAGLGAVAAFVLFAATLAAVAAPGSPVAAQGTNNQPSFGSSYSFSVASGSTSVSTVGTVAATDADSGDTLTYSLRGSDASDRMYFTGGWQRNLYSLDSDDSTVSEMLDLLNTSGLWINDPRDLTWHNGRLLLFAAYSSSSATGLFEMDTQEASGSRIAGGGSLFGIPKTVVQSLASHGGELYAAGWRANYARVYKFNLDDFSSTTVYNSSNQSKQFTGIASHNNVLYLVDDNDDKLYSLDPGTGTLTLVSASTVTSFGVSETSPRGLRSHGGSLYMLGGATDKLYTLALTGSNAGTATAVSSTLSAFGVSESDPRGIASGYDAPSGFSIDSSTGVISYSGSALVKGTYRLYAQVSDSKADDGTADTEIDDTVTVTVTVSNAAPVFGKSSYGFAMPVGTDGSSTAHALGTVSATDANSGDTVTYGLVPSDTGLYVIDDATGTANDALYTVPVTGANAGVASRVDSSLANFGLGTAEVTPEGLTWHDGALYFVGDTTNALYRVDHLTGRAARVGTATNFGTSGSGAVGGTLRGLASHGGKLWLTDGASLFELNPATGASVRKITMTREGYELRGLGSHSGTLYAHGYKTTGEYLLTVAVDDANGTGTVTRVNTAGDCIHYGTLVERGAGMASFGGTLYFIGTLDDKAYTLYTATSGNNKAGCGAKVHASNSLGISYADGIAGAYVQPSDFGIGASTGQITYTGSSASAGVDRLYVTARDSKDSDGNADTAWDAAVAVKVRVYAPNTEPTMSASSYAFKLASGSDGSATPVSVGTVSGTDADSGATLSYSLAFPFTAYVIADAADTANDALHVVDLAAGTATRVGSLDNFGLTGTYDDDAGAAGLAWHQGKLYFAGADSQHLYELDPHTGAATRFGGGWVSDSAPTGLFSAGGKLYATDSDGTSEKVYELTLSGGEVTRGTGMAIEDSSNANVTPVGVAVHSGTVYVSGDDHKLYSLAPGTGVVTQVGTATAFGATETAGPLFSHDGVLYMLGQTQNKLYSLNTSTGVATLAGGTSGAGWGSALALVDSLTGAASPAVPLADFAVGASTGAITFTGDSARSGTYSLVAGVSDGLDGTGQADAGIDDTATVTVKVQVGNRPPAFSPSVYGFEQHLGDFGNAVSPLSVGPLFASDGDGDAISYTLRDAGCAGTPASFDLATPAGSSIPRLRWRGGVVTGFSTTTLCVQASDGKGLFGGSDTAVDATASVTVRVVNRPAAFATRSYSASVAEGVDGSATPVAVTTAAAADPDPGHTVTHGLLAADAATTMWMLQDRSGVTGDGLYRLDRTAGTAAKAGWVSNYGAGASELGLSEPAWHQGRLYAVGGGGRLYVIDPVSGRAARVGSSDGFGVSERFPTGLASHGGRLYMVGRQQYRLYTLDPATGLAAVVNSGQRNFGGPPRQVRMHLASDGTSLYTTNVNRRWLERLDTSTGAASRVGSANGFGIWPPSPFFAVRGLGHSGGKLYLAGSDRKLYEISTATGSVASGAVSLASTLFPSGLADGNYTRPGGFGIASGTGAVTYTGTSAPGGAHVLYATARDSLNRTGTADTATDDAVPVKITVSNLEPAMSASSYAFNLATGSNGSTTPVAVGTVSATDANPGATLAYSLAYPFTAYVIADADDTENDALHVVDLAAGTATRVGSLDNFGLTGPHDDDAGVAGLTWHGGSLYFAGADSQHLYELDPATGAATRFGAGWVSDNAPTGLFSVGGKLYATDSDGTSEKVYELTLSGGEVTRGTGLTVKDSADANVTPVGIAVHSGTAYVTSDDHKLWSLAPATGIVTRVGTATAFGASETSGPLFSHDGALYMLGQTQNKLYTLDTSTGTAALAGGASGTGWASALALVDSLTGAASPAVPLAEFAIGASTGAVTFTGASARTGTYTLIAGVSDGLDTAGQADTSVDDTATVTVTVTAANRPAAFSPGVYGFEMHLGDTGTPVSPLSVGPLFASDGDGDAISYTLRNAGCTGTPASFDLATPAGSSIPRLRWRGGTVTGFSTTTLCVQASDGKGTFGGPDTAVDDTATVTVTVVNRAPAFASRSYAASLWEGLNGSPDALAVAAAVAADPDPGHTVTHGLLAADAASTMWMLQDRVGVADDGLYRLDRTAGTAARAGWAANYGAGASDLGLSEPAWHLGRLYAVGGSGRLYVIDPVSGRAARVGSSDGFGVNERFPTGLASHSGRLYMVGRQQYRLYTLDTATGLATAVNSSQQHFGGPPRQPRLHLASDGTSLYTTNATRRWLERLDTTTGAASRVGSTNFFGITPPSPTFAVRGLGYSGTKLHLAGSDRKLYEISTSTGAVASGAVTLASTLYPSGLADGNYTRPGGFEIASATGAVAYTGSSTPEGIHVLYATARDSLSRAGSADTAADDAVPVTVTVADEVPGVPGTVAAAARDQALAVTWTAPASDGGSTVTDYDVQYRACTQQSDLTCAANPTWGDWTEWNAADTSTALAATVTGLTNGTAYQVQVRAQNAVGNGAWSASAQGQPSPQPVVSLALSAASIGEDGGTAAVTASLSRASTADTTVTVTVTPVSPAASADIAVTGTTTLTCAAGGTSCTGTTTVTAVGNDVDAADKTFTVSGAAVNDAPEGVGGPADVTLTVTDDDTAGVTVSASSLTVAEAGTGTYTVVLDSEPTADVTVTAAVATGGDPSITVSPASVTFTSSNWDTARTVTVSAAADDADAVDGAATVNHTLSSGDAVYAALTGLGSVAVTEDDDDATLVLTSAALSGSRLTVPEGGSVEYTVRLKAQPSASVVVTPTRAADGDDDITISFVGDALTFTAIDWDTPQTVAVDAAEDADSADGTRLISHAVSGAAEFGVAGPTLTAAEADNDRATAPPRTGGTTGTGTGSTAGGAAGTSQRLAGADRYATSTAAADAYVKALAAASGGGTAVRISTVIVASGRSFPDALAAAALSRAHRAPVLLTDPDELPTAAAQFIARHRITKAIVLGGAKAVSAGVQQRLEQLGAAVTRIAGADRYATAAQAARSVGRPGVLCGTTQRAVILASGTSWPDAVAAGPLAYLGGHPILLTHADRLADPVAAYLADTAGIGRVLLVGGTSVIAEQVADQIRAMGIEPVRVAGANRNATAAALAAHAQAPAGATTSAAARCFGRVTVGLANGLDYPDALTAAALLGVRRAPLLFTTPDGIPPETLAYARSASFRPGRDAPPVVTIGGTKAVPADHPKQLTDN